MNHHEKLHSAKKKHRDSLRWDEKIGLWITDIVATMACAVVFTGIAFIALPQAIESHSMTVLINWFSGNWMQFVLLPIILLGQGLQSKKSDQLMLKVYEDSELLKELVQDNTALTKEIHMFLRPLPTKKFTKK